MKNNANIEMILSGNEHEIHPAFWPAQIGQRTTLKDSEIEERIQSVLSHIQLPLQKQHIWELAASIHAPKWTNARARLREAEVELDTVFSPDNEPLGAIGMAMDYEEVHSVHDTHTHALALFTIANEALHRDEDNPTHILFESLCTQQETIEQILKLAENTRDIVTKPVPPTVTLGSLSKAFKRYASRVFKTPVKGEPASN